MASPEAARTPRSPSSSLPPSSQPPLLRLTTKIRLHLYRYIGLTPWDASPYKFDLRGEQADYMPYGGVPDPPGFHGLLLCCRAIYLEAAALLYSTNYFIVHYFPSSPSKPPGLQPLRALTAVSLRSLSNLKVVVNEAACHRLTPTDYLDVCCRHGRGDRVPSGMNHCQKKHGGLHKPPLLSLDLGGGKSDGDDGDELGEGNVAKCEWRSAAAHIFSWITPNRLAFSLVCDIDPQHPLALDLADSVVAPFHLLPPSHLRECRIRLAAVPNEQFHQVAKNAALHAACGVPAAPLSSKLTSHAAATTLASLPRELRIRILEYTDLVTPRRQVIWSREDRAYVVHVLQTDQYFSTPDELYSDQFFHCWLDKSEGCFCRRRHAAFSVGCKCWAPPPALFLLCRALSQDALYVFFSSNRFIVQDYTASVPWLVPSSPQQQPLTVSRGQRDVTVAPPNYPADQFAVSEFLSKVVPASALSHIRFLELVFPPYHPQTWPRTEHPAVRGWWDLVEWFRDKVNLRGLTLKIIVVGAQNGAPDPPRITTEEGGLLMKAYMDLLRPLPPLAKLGLARFYAHFPYPWEGGPESDPYRGHDGNWVWRQRMAVKNRLERYVMGDRYESLYADGKQEPVASDWDLAHFSGRW